MVNLLFHNINWIQTNFKKQQQQQQKTIHNSLNLSVTSAQLQLFCSNTFHLNIITCLVIKTTNMSSYDVERLCGSEEMRTHIQSLQLLPIRYAGNSNFRKYTLHLLIRYQHTKFIYKRFSSRMIIFQRHQLHCDLDPDNSNPIFSHNTR